MAYSLLRDIFPSPSEINMLKAAEKRTEQKWNNPQLVLFPQDCDAVAKLRWSCMHSCLRFIYTLSMLNHFGREKSVIHVAVFLEGQFITLLILAPVLRSTLERDLR